MQRLALDEKSDLVLAFGSAIPIDPRWFWWVKDARVGLFLQEKSATGQVHQLAIEPGPNDDCAAVLENMTAQDLVLSCSGEKSGIYEHDKFVYDIRAKALRKHFSYAPFRVSRVLTGSNGFQFVMQMNSYFVDRTSDGRFRMATRSGQRTRQYQSALA